MAGWPVGPVVVDGVRWSGGRWPVGRCPVAGAQWPVAGGRWAVAGGRMAVAGGLWPAGKQRKKSIVERTGDHIRFHVGLGKGTVEPK